MKSIRKAVIPAAGAGTRLLPATKVVPKVFLPVLSREGRLIPAIHAIIAEAISGGIERIALVVSPEEKPFFRRYFFETASTRLLKALSRSSIEVDPLEGPEELGRKVEIIIQEEPEGFGDAVAQTKEWVGDEPFLLLLGDHVYRSRSADTCTLQLVRVYGELGANVVGVSRLPESALSRRGIIAGKPLDSRASVYRAAKIMEKPDVRVARKELRTPGLPEGYYLALFGNYILRPGIFPVLDAMIEADRRFKGEIQLTHALAELGVSMDFYALEIEGESFDMGRPESYQRAFGALIEK